jgi:undecaprenyl diphosphate synthase
MKLDKGKFPRHIAFIMDGNGRWAKRRGLPRTVGHKFGYGKMKTVVKRCSEHGIAVVSLFAFSTENWNRPAEEVDEIFRIVRENMNNDLPLFMEWNIKICTMGDVTKFPNDLQDTLKNLVQKTKDNTGTILNLCINYGGRADIVHAVNAILATKTKVVDETEFERYLYGANLPHPDLVVRTSGEQRISNFLLWQMAYSELLFIKQFWPDMNARIVDRCIAKFGKRKRRFGSVK